MTNKRFWFSVFSVWIVLFATDWAFHGVWLQPWYQATAQFWRPMAEMQKMLPLLWVGNFIFAWAFVWVYSKGISKDNQWHQAFRYALAILCLSKIPEQLGMWAMSPYPGELVARWALVSFVQAFACSFAMTWTFQPLTWAKRVKA
jgi:hypothetical protein